MRSSQWLLIVAAAVMLVGGCYPGPSQTSVRLVNNANSPVRVDVFYGEDQNVLEGLLEEYGQRLEYTIEPGGYREFSRDCDDLQAIKVRGDLQVIVGLGPSESTRVYRDGSDFGCGDALTFTFTQSITATDLDISFGQGQ